MHNITSHRRSLKGFTLIELAIVLVIIGLIAGGVIGGKSLIESAKLQGVINEKQYYETAWRAFILKYDALPGDFDEGYAYFSGGDNTVCGTNGGLSDSSCNGNGDNQINYYDGIRAFKHLQLAGILSDYSTPFQSGMYSNTSPGSAAIDASDRYNVPQSKAIGNENVGWDFISPISLNNPDFYGKQGSWLQIGAHVGWWMLDGAALTQRQAHAIDKKIDDGMPATGMVTALSGGDPNADPLSVATNTVTDCNTSPISFWRRLKVAHSATAEYNITHNDISCALHFYLGD